ncbi:hypothetical protein F2Q70_00035656 [Brassica cretica]|uniref:Clathrin adaptor alpha/beta/gamma-adaptin appendage Ig-like subdomain domain-containing protein n=1 Tax=Brassica cretica TaxID=69181 RepID=A0A8S9JZP2_BRACR|nr:hypothetical protein F2Q70_00035656 [Brassica cretica]
MGPVSPSGIPSPYGRARRSCSMLLPCTPPHGIVHTFRMGALPGQAQPRAVHPGAVWHPGSGISGSASVLPRALILVLRLSQSAHGHHDSPARRSYSSVVWGCPPPLRRLHHWAIDPHRRHGIFAVLPGALHSPRSAFPLGSHSRIGVKAEWRGHHGRLVLFLGNKVTSPLTSVQALILPPAHLKLELSLVPDTIPPRAQVQCPLEVMSIRPSRDVAVLDFSYKFGTSMVSAKLRLPAVLNKFLQPLQLTSEEFFPQWRSLSGPPLKLQEVVRGVRPLSLPEMENLFNSFRVTICPGLDPNPNNLVASTTFYSENTRPMLCLARIETDPADRTQLRLTVASGDSTLTFELKEFIKEQLIAIPMGSRALVPAVPVPAAPLAQPPSPAVDANDPGAMLAGLL